MRIAIVSSMFPPIRSGSSHYALTIAKGLAKQGYNVLVISARAKGTMEYSEFDHATIPSLIVPSTPITHGYPLPYCYYPIAVPLMKSILERFDPDIVHANGHFLDAPIMAGLCANKMEIPLALTIHTRFVHTNSIFNSLMRYIDRSFLRWVWRKADSIIALDRQMYYYILHSFAIPHSKIFPIPLSVDVFKLLSEPIINIEKLGLSKDIRMILSLSVIAVQFNVIR